MSSRKSSTLSPYAPVEIEVGAPRGRPESVLVGKRRIAVREVENEWRIDEEWWRRPVSRLYFSVELAGGGRMTLFRDLFSGRWYRQNWV